MKKNIIIILLAIITLFTPNIALAYENNIWSTNEVTKKVTSEGLLVEESIDLVCTDEWHGMCFAQGYVYTITFTIPADYEEETIVLAPEIFKAFSEAGLEKVVMPQPGDSLKINVKIINNSKYIYDYDETSFEIYSDNINIPDYKKIGTDTEDTTFDGKTTDKVDTVYRSCNTAITSIFPECNYTVDNQKNYLSDATLGQKLIEIGYTNGIADLDEYFLDFYNEKYNTSFTSLSEFPKFMLRDVFGQNDGLYNLTTIWKSIGVNGTGGDFTSASKFQTYQNKMQEITNKLAELGYDNLASYAIDYINQTEGTEYTNLSELSHDLQHKYFTYYGNEKSQLNVLETNTTLKAVAYDFFYNELLTFEFNNAENNQDPSKDLSIGEYMRTEDKGDAEIIENAGKLTSGSSYELNDNTLRVNGIFTINAYQNYNFNFQMHWSYTAVKGNVIVKYVDFSTGEEFEKTAEELSDLIGRHYTTNEKAFDGYTFISVDGETTGKFTEETIYVTYYYDKNIGTGDIEELPPQTGYNTNNITVSQQNKVVLYKKED